MTACFCEKLGQLASSQVITDDETVREAVLEIRLANGREAREAVDVATKAAFGAHARVTAMVNNNWAILANLPYYLGELTLGD